MSSEYPIADEPESDPAVVESEDVLYEEQVKPEFGILGFTLRELLIVGVWLVSFVVSFFPLAASTSLWGSGLQWIIPIGIPTAAVFLIVLRRFSPDGIRRVGSLGIDQFASVAFSFAALFWAQLAWELIAGWLDTGIVLPIWVCWVQLVLALALVVFTVAAPLIPGLREDFRGRLETLAHRNANPVRPVIPRPRPVIVPAAAPDPQDLSLAVDPQAPSPAAAPSHLSAAETTVLDIELSGENTTDEIARLGLATQVPITSHASGGDTGTAAAEESDYVPGYARRSRRDDAPVPHIVERAFDDTHPREAVVAPQPFWILAPTERDVYDERGEVLFRIGPTDWALVIEDRGGAYVVRHDDSRIGYLHDISDITKG